MMTEQEASQAVIFVVSKRKTGTRDIQYVPPPPIYEACAERSVERRKTGGPLSPGHPSARKARALRRQGI